MIFVTGGTGLIGSHLLAELVKKNEPITAIYRNSKKIETVKRVFDFYLGTEAKRLFSLIRWVPCDVLDVVQLEEAMKGHTIVYHCAANVSFKRRDYLKMMQTNRTGTENIVNLCLSLKFSKLCYVSSTAAVGNKDIPSNVEVTENGKWEKTDETSGYSISKYSAEKEVWRGIEEGLNAVIINPSVVIGAGDWNESSLVIFRTISRGLRFYSPGANAFVDARDVVKIMVDLVEKDIKNERFLCIGENLSFQSLFNMIADCLGKKRPSYKVSPLLMGVAWRLATLWAALTFRSPAITRSSARSAFNVTRFSNEKVKKTLNHEFIPIDEAVSNAVLYSTHN
ncbi:MAG: NAD-dependent epimerase/dehydratase family protein [Crocinitomicaceae bacterium]|nr:NAD-dependent epimerase/dehydratase family protein [Crocinitomicaceae bacterium]